MIFDNPKIKPLSITESYATLKRILTKLIRENFITTTGQGKGTKYAISPVFELLEPIDMEKYYEKEIDERDIKRRIQLFCN